jgi:hypothetical protein
MSVVDDTRPSRRLASRFFARWNDIPEVAHLSKADRDRVWREAMRDPFRLTDLLWLLLILLISTMYAPLCFEVFHLKQDRWAGVAAIVVFATFQNVCLGWVFRARYRPIVLRMMKPCE